MEPIKVQIQVTFYRSMLGDATTIFLSPFRKVAHRHLRRHQTQATVISNLVFSAVCPVSGDSCEDNNRVSGRETEVRSGDLWSVPCLLSSGPSLGRSAGNTFLISAATKCGEVVCEWQSLVS